MASTNQQVALHGVCDCVSGPSVLRRLLTHSLTRAVKENDKKYLEEIVEQIIKYVQSNAHTTKEGKDNNRQQEKGEKEECTTYDIQQKQMDEDVTTRVDRALRCIRSGCFVVVTDGEDRENEGDLILAAEHATADRLAFMVNHTSGIICVGITQQRCQQLQLPQMVQENTESHATAFTVSCDYKHGSSTGISAADRARTIRALADPTAQPMDFNRPGHVFPLRAKQGGVMQRPGHTEASVDLARMAGCYPAGVLCEIVNTMARPSQLRTWSDHHGLTMISIADIIQYRKMNNK